MASTHTRPRAYFLSYTALVTVTAFSCRRARLAMTPPRQLARSMLGRTSVVMDGKALIDRVMPLPSNFFVDSYNKKILLIRFVILIFTVSKMPRSN